MNNVGRHEWKMCLCNINILKRSFKNITVRIHDGINFRLEAVSVMETAIVEAEI